ncbi:MAG: hypothetical protein NZL93_00125 [Chthoniobacterales bacterium]|nr:hypothetical protein [Chthoniobacterales bacterium]
MTAWISARRWGETRVKFRSASETAAELHPTAAATSRKFTGRGLGSPKKGL